MRDISSRILEIRGIDRTIEFNRQRICKFRSLRESELASLEDLMLKKIESSINRVEKLEFDLSDLSESDLIDNNKEALLSMLEHYNRKFKLIVYAIFEKTLSSELKNIIDFINQEDKLLFNNRKSKFYDKEELFGFDFEINKTLNIDELPLINTDKMRVTGNCEVALPFLCMKFNFYLDIIYLKENKIIKGAKLKIIS